MSFEHIKRQDPAVYASIVSELQRQRDYIELIASENFVSPAVMEAMGSPLTNKYAEGYPRARYYGGCRFVDEVEQLAIDRALAPSTPTSSRTPARRPTPRCTSPSSSRATRSSAWTSATAAT